MIIKTTIEIQEECLLKSLGKHLITSDHLKANKKWVSVESLKEWIDNNSFGYRDNGFNTIDGDQLRGLLENE